MKIKQIIINNKDVYLFTDNPQKDVLELQKAYDEKKDFEIPLGYERPEIINYKFLDKEYPCISLWFDNEDIPKYFKN